MPQKVLIMVTFGEDHPDRYDPPLHLATLSTTLDTEVQMIYTMDGGLLLKKGIAEKLSSGEDRPTYIEMVREAKEFGVKIYICSPVLERNNLTREDFIDEVDDIVGGMYAVTEAIDADLVFTF
jgi:predicted peroxiredoxin